MEYLNEAISEEVSGQAYVSGVAGQTQESSASINCDITFPKAKGLLQRMLSYHMSDSVAGPEWGPSQSDVDYAIRDLTKKARLKEERSRYKQYKKIYVALAASIHELQDSLFEESLKFNP